MTSKNRWLPTLPQPEHCERRQQPDLRHGPQTSIPCVGSRRHRATRAASSPSTQTRGATTLTTRECRKSRNAGRAGPAGSAASPGSGPGRHLLERVPGRGTPGARWHRQTKDHVAGESHRVTSPSSGYSSQSNTPTALTPVPVFLKSVSPASGKEAQTQGAKKGSRLLYLQYPSPPPPRLFPRILPPKEAGR